MTRDEERGATLGEATTHPPYQDAEAPLALLLFASLTRTLFPAGSIQEHLASYSLRGKTKTKTKKKALEPIGWRQVATVEQRDTTPNSF